MRYRDFEEFLASCNAHGVRYLVVGAHAVAFHSRPRATKYLDVYVEPTAENAERLLAAIREFFGGADLGFTDEDVTELDTVLQLGVAPVRIDLLSSLSGIESFDRAWRQREDARYGAVNTHYLSLDDLISAKRSATAGDEYQPVSHQLAWQPPCFHLSTGAAICAAAAGGVRRTPRADSARSQARIDMPVSYPTGRFPGSPEDGRRSAQLADRHQPLPAAVATAGAAYGRRGGLLAARAGSIALRRTAPDERPHHHPDRGHHPRGDDPELPVAEREAHLRRRRRRAGRGRGRRRRSRRGRTCSRAGARPSASRRPRAG